MEKTDNAERKGGSLVLHTWMYFVGMTLIILISLWALEAIVFKTAYRRMKEDEIIRSCDRIIGGFDDSNYSGGEIPDNLKAIVDDEVKHAAMKLAVFRIAGEGVDVIVSADPSLKDEAGAIPTEAFDEDSDFFARLSASEGDRVIYHDGSTRRDYTLVVGMKKATADGDVYFYASANVSQNDMASDLLTRQMITVTIFCCGVAAVMSFVFSKSISRPISEFAATARRLGKGEHVRFEPVGVAEYDELAAALNNSAEETENAEKMRRDFLANVSHDLRTPLTMVKAYAEMIRDISGGDEKKRAEHCKVIIDEVDRLTLLVNDILDLSKLQSGARKPETADVDLSRVLRAVTERFAIMERRGYTLTKDIPETALVRCDERMLEQILYNLVGNAFSYTGEDKRVDVKVEITADGVKTSVSDSGKGIAPSEIDKVWDRYYRASQTKRAVAGSGIGLSIVKQLFEVNGATYGIDSVINRGSTFWFVLPAAGGDDRKRDRTEDKTRARE